MPEPPPPSPWDLDVARARPGDDLVAVGADLAPSTVFWAYVQGLFPMGLGHAGAPPLGWWSPDPRGILLPGDLHVSRSLARTSRRFRVTWDTAFDDVVAACADPSRDGRWITADIQDAYGRLHRQGWAHSVEVWQGEDLVGGLYGLAIQGLFAGESMFHRATDASKVAVRALHDLVAADGDERRIIDVQWRTPHLASLGVTEIPRHEYLTRLRTAMAAPLPAPFR